MSFHQLKVKMLKGEKWTMARSSTPTASLPCKIPPLSLFSFILDSVDSHQEATEIEKASQLFPAAFHSFTNLWL